MASLDLLKNGQYAGFQDFDVNMTIPGIKGSFSVKQYITDLNIEVGGETENLYGMSYEPIGYGYKTRKYSGNMKIYKEFADYLKSNASGIFKAANTTNTAGSLSNIQPFSIEIIKGISTMDTTLRTKEYLSGIRFNGTEKTAFSADSTNTQVTIDFVFTSYTPAQKV